jgi:hypothetical protein
VAAGLNMVDPLERFRLDYAPLLLRYRSQRHEFELCQRAFMELRAPKRPILGHASS